MGLLQASDWKASWIEPADPKEVGEVQPNPYLRKDFRVKRRIKSARLYISAHGLYEVEINGMKPNEWLFTPGWTSYNKHLQYQTYDVTELLRNGQNAIGVLLVTVGIAARLVGIMSSTITVRHWGSSPS
jgi:alpha-L-rhamnosidase